tara:strand:- start:598 stop:1221 length:624 start_codon:yes stop_codon:yes gene_type:complete
MLKFNNLRKLREGVGSPAADYTKSLTQDDDEEATTYKPRSKGEEDFAAKHTKDTKAHPVAPEDQFKGGTKHSGDHKGYENAPGEKNVVKAKKTFAQLRGGGSSKRKADKTQGDIAMKKVKEEFELNEEMVAENPMLMKTLSKMASSKTPMPMKFKRGQPMTVDQDQAKTLLKGLKTVKGPSLKAMTRDITSSPSDFMKALAFADKAR